MKDIVIDHTGEWKMIMGQATFDSHLNYKNKILGCNKSFCLSFFENNVYHFGFLQEELLTTNFFNDLKDEELSNYMVNIRMFIDKCKSHLKIVNSYEDIINLYEILKELVAYYQLSNTYFINPYYKYIYNMIDNKVFDANYITGLIFAPDSTNLIHFKEAREWEKITNDYLKKNIVNIKRVINNHLYKFGMGNYKYQTNYYKVNYNNKFNTLNQKDHTKLKQYIEYTSFFNRNIKDIVQCIYNELSLKDTIYNKSRIIAELSGIRLELNEIRSIIGRNIYDYINKIALDRNDSLDLVHLMTLDELKKYLKQKYLDKNLLLRRKEFHYLVLNNNKVKIYGGLNEKLSFLKEYNFVENKNSSKLYGSVIFGNGIITGLTKIINNLDNSTIMDFLKEQPEKSVIAIIPSLKPYIIPLFKYFKAILVKEGGMTSHASIVAREMRIPCIIGVGQIENRINDEQQVFINFEDGSINLNKPNIINNKMTYIKRIKENIEEHKLTPKKINENKLIVDLYSKGNELGLIGGKAYNLTLMNSERIPYGFVITVNGVLLLRKNDVTFKDLVLKHLIKYKFTEIAIRSSGILEDSDNLSYAGIYNSKVFIDSKNIEHFFESIYEIMQSTNSKLYEYYNAINSKENINDMAIIIQQVIYPFISGLAITSYIKNDEGWLIIEFTDKHLSNIADGSITPFKVEINRNTKTIIPNLLDYFIPKYVVDELINILIETEEIYKKPQEIEWIIDKNMKLWIIQSRVFNQWLES